MSPISQTDTDRPPVSCATADEGDDRHEPDDPRDRKGAQAAAADWARHERFQVMLDELREIAHIADELGYDALTTAEHHFHTEGGEANPRPLLLSADLAGRSNRLMFMPPSRVLPTWDPIRLAEEVAMLDQLFPGRTGVALARGYQARWVPILSQRGNAMRRCAKQSRQGDSARPDKSGGNCRRIVMRLACRCSANNI